MNFLKFYKKVQFEMANPSPPLQRPERISPGTFVTEMKNVKRYTNSARSNRAYDKSKPSVSKMSSLPSINGQPSYTNINFGRVKSGGEIEFDQGKLDQTYELLVNEIVKLKADIRPIRHYYLKLKDRLLFQSKCTVDSNMNLLLSENYPDLIRAIGDGGTFSALIENYQAEIDDNVDRIDELKNYFSSFKVVKLSCEVDKERNELIQMQETLKDYRSKRKQIEKELMLLRQSENINKIDSQRNAMKEAILSLSKAEQRNKKLKDSLLRLENELILTPKPSFDSSTQQGNQKKNNSFSYLPQQYQEAFNEIGALNRELSEKRDLYLSKCEKLIATRNQQLIDLQLLDKLTNKKENQMNPRLKNLNRNNKSEPFPISEPTERPNTGRNRKSIESQQNHLDQQVDETIEEEESDEGENDDIALILMKTSNDKPKGEELQEIPTDDENFDDNGNAGINIDD